MPPLSSPFYPFLPPPPPHPLTFLLSRFLVSPFHSFPSLFSFLLLHFPFFLLLLFPFPLSSPLPPALLLLPHTPPPFLLHPSCRSPLGPLISSLTLPFFFLFLVSRHSPVVVVVVFSFLPYPYHNIVLFCLSFYFVFVCSLSVAHVYISHYPFSFNELSLPCVCLLRCLLIQKAE